MEGSESHECWKSQRIISGQQELQSNQCIGCQMGKANLFQQNDRCAIDEPLELSNPQICLSFKSLFKRLTFTNAQISVKDKISGYLLDFFKAILESNLSASILQLVEL